MEDGVMQFEDLEAWRWARELVKGVYHMTATEEIRRDFGFKDQIQRAAVSIMSNIAEGFERVSLGEKAHFYSIARGSCGETRSLLYLAEDLFPENAEAARRLRGDAIKVGKLISGLIRATDKRKI